MDKKTYEMLFDKSIKEEYRKKYLIEEYHEYEKERYYKRKINNINHIDLIEDRTISNIEKYEIDINNKIIHEAIKTLTKR